MTATINSSFLILEPDLMTYKDLYQSEITTLSNTAEQADASKLVHSIWGVGSAVTLSLLMLLVVIACFVRRTMKPRFGYAEFRGRERQMAAITQLLEEIRGHPRSVKPSEPLTESERHFLLHDYHDFF